MATDFNPESLARFRNQRRISRDEVSKYLGTTLERVVEFESGTREPTSLQAERMSELLGIGVVDLFGESSVEIEDDLIDYRTRNLTPAKLSANGLKKVVRAEKHARFTKFLLSELRDNFVPALPRPKGDLTKDYATTLRQTFDEWKQRASSVEQIGGNQESQFLTWLRIYTELQGAITAVHDAPEEDYWGFYTDAGVDLPSIFINRSIQTKKSQLFTFCHEMAHYIEDAEGISNPYSASNEIEKRCNQFSAEFLAPEDQFSSTVENFGRTVRNDVSVLVDHASKLSLLSKQATVTRLRELGYIKSHDYTEWFKSNVNWYRKEKRIEIDSAPIIPNLHHARALGEIGYLPIYLSSLAISRNLIDAFDVESALGISRKTQIKAFALARRRIEAVIDDAP